jgi:diguanylate cyclase (GGDEF)-like protein
MFSFLKRFKYYIAGLLLANALLIAFFYQDMQSKRLIYLEQNINTITAQLRATTNGYRLLSHYVFDEMRQDRKLLELLHLALDANEAERQTLRQAVLTHLHETYQRLRQYHFSQLSFTFPDGTVFVRFHKTYDYGDKADEAKLTLSLGKLNAPDFTANRRSLFTYSKPMYDTNGTLAATVHLAIAFDVFKTELTKLFPSHYDVIISRDIAMKALASQSAKRFAQSDFGDTFYYEVAARKHNDIRALIQRIDTQIKPEVLGRLTDFKPFALAAKEAGQWFSVSFVPLSATQAEQRRIGYLVAYTPDTAIESFETAFIFRVLSGNLLFGFILLFIYYLDRHARELKELASHDTLTGIYNRRAFDRIAEEEFERAKRYKRPFALIIFDIDHFKAINDTYGHKVGDAALKGLVKLVQSNIRRHDFFARWGGEEFAVLTTETGGAEAVQLAEKLRALLEQHTFETIGHFTASFGVAQFDESMPNIDTLFQQADEALYRAKENGRNRVELYNG